MKSVFLIISLVIVCVCSTPCLPEEAHRVGIFAYGSVIGDPGSEIAAVRVDSEVSEDEVKVVVLLKEGEKLTNEELIAYCDDRMPYFMVPRYVEFKKALPKTATERIEKYKLEEEGITENTWDREKSGYKLKR